ncbi:MAG: NAD(P)-dependent oxidoreductase [Spirochaetaceae bacterium]|nr:NAD(P)-dependent oxidoreductase [Spirochaetaceae bacterium]
MILVTGASGFIGGKLAERLVNEGFKVRCVYRRTEVPTHLRRLETMGAELVRCDLTKSVDLKILLKDVHGVIHAAAKASDWGSIESFDRINCKATEKLFRESSSAGVKKALYLSSLSVHGFGHHKETSEAGPYYPLINPYQISKKKGEEIALSLNGPDMNVSVIRPGNVYGPDDLTTMFPIFKAMEKGIMGFIDGGKRLSCPVYIDDLLDAIVLVWHSEKANGQIFNITGGEIITWREILEINASCLGIKSPGLNIPGTVAMRMAKLMKSMYKAFKSRSAPPLTPYRVAQLVHDYHFSIDKATELLGYQPHVPYREGIKETVRSYRSQS